MVVSDSGPDPLLAVDDLRVEFWTDRGTIYAVNGISFEIAAGETLGIVGESGCGKSVTSLALLGILPRAGRVAGGTARFEGRDLFQLPDRELRQIRGKKIAMIFQDPMSSLNPVLTIGKQIREVLETYGGFAPSTLQFLKTISQAIGRDDAELAGQVFRGVRDRIAVALHKRQCAVIAQLNSLNAAFAQGR